MHLSEGVLHSQTLIAGTILAAVGVSIGLRHIQYEKLPLTALFAAAFFVASTIHIPVGIGSVHLILNGLAGLFLGWAVFPAFLIALALQVLFFGFGGFSVLGVNLCIMAYPAVLVYALFRPLLAGNLSRAKLLGIGIGCGLIGIVGAIVLAACVLAIDNGKTYVDLIYLLVISHIPVLVIDALISASILFTLKKMQPQLFQP